MTTRTGRRFSILFAAIAALAKTGSAAARREFFRSARVLAAVACLALVAALALPGAAQAQTTTTFVSNTGESRDRSAGSIMAQSFTAGSNPDGYTLSDVALGYRAVASGADITVTRVKIRKDNAGAPGDLVANLLNPATFSLGILSFAAPANTTLEAGETYWVVINEGYDNSTERMDFDTTSSDYQTVTTADPNWSIADTRLWKNTVTASWASSARVLMLAVNGTAVGDTPTPSTDATLSGLSLGTGVTLDPAFAPGTLTYAVAVGNAVDEVTVAPTTTDTNATPEFLTASDTTLDDADGVAANGHQVALAVGDNVFKVQVTAEDGTTTQTYTVTVNRAAPAQSVTTLVSNTGQGDSTVRANSVGAQPFTTGSAAVLTSVGVYLDSNPSLNVRDIRVRILQDDSGSPGTELVTLSNPTAKIDDAVNTFTAPAGTNLAAATTYYVEMSRRGEWGVYYRRTESHLEDAGGATNWEIGNTRYYKTNSGDPWTTSTAVMLIAIKGTAAGGTPSTDATLSDLVVNDGSTDLTLDPTFVSGTTSYTAAVGNGVDEVTVTATTTDTGATPEFLNASDTALADAGTAAGHQVALAVGDTVFKVQVTAEDGTTTQPYTVTVTRAAADTPTCTLNTGDIWCGVVTPASHLVDGVAFGHGFVEDTPDTGALSDKEFSVVTDGVTNSYTIDAVVVAVGISTGSLSFSLTSALTAAERAKLVLHVDDGSSDQFAFSASGNPYVWPGTDLDWSSGDPVTLRLRDSVAVPTDAPTDFTATVGDAQVALAWKAARLYSGVTGHEFRYKMDGDYPATWKAIAYSGPDEANEDGFTVTGLTNEVAHTFELRAVNASGAGAAATAGPVTPTPGICGRTQQIQDVILAEISGVDDCAAVTVANLASIVTFGAFGLSTFNQGITSLQKGDFAGLTSLTILNLGVNGLTSLPEGIFAGLDELYELNLSSNELESLPEGAFDGLVKLGILGLVSNKFTEFSEGAFSGLTALEDLQLGSNQLETLPEEVFSGLTSLRSLSLIDDDLSSLPEELFSGLTALRVLELHDNNLDSLPEGLFSGLTALSKLYLDGNPTNPMELTVTVEKVGTNQVRAKVLVGAPFAVDIPVTVVDGTLAGSATALSVAAGSVEGTAVTVTRTAGTTAAVTVDVDLTTPPTLPLGHRGYIFKKATTNLPATILPDATNAAPSFTSSTTFNPAENQTAVGTVMASDDDMDDDITGYALSGGADQALFSIGSTSGVLTFQAAPNYEDPQDANTDNAYVVVVRATSGTGARVKTADQTITVTVMDEDEQPDTPAKPTVTATSGSSTSLDVSWTEPGLNGGPEIIGYEVQYQSRASATDAWSAGVDWTHTGTTTTAITGPTADTEYQVQVKALNGETPSAWSDYSDAVSTNSAADTPTTEVTIAADQPAFTAELDDVIFTLIRTGDPAAALDVAVALTQDRDLLKSEYLAQTVSFGAGEATATLKLLPFFSWATW